MDAAWEKRIGMLEKRVRFWKASCLAIGSVGTVGVLGCLMGFQASGAKKIIGVSGGDAYIYRVYDDGSIDFIQADGSIKSPKGIPNWVPIPIDPDLKRQSR